MKNNEKETIAQVLRDCGLFIGRLKQNPLKCKVCNGVGWYPDKVNGDTHCTHQHVPRLLPCDEAATMLGKIGLQVVWDNQNKVYDLVDSNWACLKSFEIPLGEIEWALNAGLSHMVETDLEKVRGSL